MPINGKDRTTDRLLEMLACPPVIILLKVTHSNATSATGNSKLVFIRRPTNKSGCTVDTQEHKAWFPYTSFLSPHISVTVLRTGHNTVGVGCNINARDNLIVLE